MPQPQSIRRALALLTIAGALALSACRPPPADTTREPSPLNAATLDLLTRSGEFPADDAAVTAAEDRLIARCMAAKGFRYTAHPAGIAPSYEDRMVDLPRRRRDGYGLEADTPAQTPTARTPAGYAQAFSGGPADLRSARVSGSVITYSTGGCLADADRRLFGNLELAVQIRYVPQGLNMSLTKPANQAPEFVAAMGRWRNCMAAHALPYRSPDDARNAIAVDYRTTGHTPAMHRRETQVAVTDGQCLIQAGVPSAVLSVRRNLAQALPTTDQHRLTELTESWRTTVARAKAITS